MSPAESTVGAAVSAPALDAESAQWIGALRARGPEREAALDALHARLLRIARGELRQEGFRGESRFLTWAYKFVVFEVSNKLGRHFWRRPTTALDSQEWERLPARFGLDPAQRAEWGELIDAPRRAIEQDLSARQRSVFVAIVLDDVPLDALVVELDANRNAIYKTMFDARRKLRAALVANGHLDADR